MNAPTEATPTEPDPAPKPDKGLHRHKKQRTSRQKETPFWRRYGLVIIVAVCAVAGLLFLLNPLALVVNNSPEESHSTVSNSLIWLTETGGSQKLGGLLLLVCFPLGIMTVRQNILHNARLWRRSGCPRCGRDDLRRTRRNWRDHLINRLGIPVRRYICADCHWEGARIDEGHI